MIDYSNFHIIVDTREQQPWDFGTYPKTVAKLDTGDYSLQGLEELFCIERKMSVSEVANNIVEKRWKDVVKRLESYQYPFLLCEFNLQDVYDYPVGSDVPRRMWGKLRVKSGFIMKHILEMQVKHGIHTLFCGDSDNASKLALSLMRKIYELHGQPS